ncbi:unnamed protein product [Anisakis simplex]|uniref:Leukocyte receptor cluster member 1 (inferred by orthology to a human protein) n=1 Tax=Anisakis simplex TaxID=6269 RepID=A0A0M3JXB8_ANISI|nr:unnamed protein product [Anisakis simplex]
MNILPKKKWHVRTKENVARVRKDQKLAAEEEKRISERAQIAEQQFKVHLLRKNADERMFHLYEGKQNETRNKESIQLEGPSGHVNLFAELEEEDRKNLGTTNKEYEIEKRKEQEEYESKVGILKYLGEGSNEFAKQKCWYEQLPSKRSIDVSEEATSSRSRKIPSGVMDLGKPTKPTETESKKERKRKKHKKKHRQSSSKEGKNSRNRKRCRSADSDEVQETTYSTSVKSFSNSSDHLEALRLERLKREEMERRKAFDLLNPKDNNSNHKQSYTAKYSSQFNPELAKQNRH